MNSKLVHKYEFESFKKKHTIWRYIECILMCEKRVHRPDFAVRHTTSSKCMLSDYYIFSRYSFMWKKNQK